MNFIIYNKTTGRIDQTGYTLWEAPAASPEYTAAQKWVGDLNKALQKAEIKTASLTKDIEVKQQNFDVSYEEGQKEFYQQEVERVSEDLVISKLSLDKLKIIETTSYNEAKQNFLDSICEKTQTAMEGTADALVQKVRISDKTLISRDPDPIPFGNINRSRRDSLLNLSDWTQVPDSPLSSSAKESWKVYRAALRDLPSSVSTFSTAYLEPSDMPVKP